MERSPGLSVLLFAVTAALLLVSTESQVAVVNLPTPPPSGGPSNGGQFRFATVSWVKLEHDPPVIRFTVEAAFRRGFTAQNFRGTGADGLLVHGDVFQPNGLESVMVDFGDGHILTPMRFTTIAYSVSEDWVQGVSTFDHTYAPLTSSNPHVYTAYFKGCCRLSTLVTNSDTSWSLPSIMNVRDDWSSPRITILPVVTVLQKMRPSHGEPSFYVPANENFSPAQPTPPSGVRGAAASNWSVAVAIGSAPASIGKNVAPANLQNLHVDSATGLVRFCAGPVYRDESSTSVCTPGLGGLCAGSAPGGGTVPQLAAGMYNAVLILKMRGSTAPVEFMINLVAQDPATQRVMPRLYSHIPDLFYPAFQYDKHVAYVGFPIIPFQISASTTINGVNVGFTVGRLPEGTHLTTVQGGASALAYHCAGGARYCMQNPGTACNGTSSPTCTCMSPNTNESCAGVGAATCTGGGMCRACWELGLCPTLEANMSVTWTPVAGQEGVHTMCFDAIAQRPPSMCPVASTVGCSPMPSEMHCVAIDVRQETPPHLWTSFAADLDPYANSRVAYLGRPLTFTVYSNDTNCQDHPVISMGRMPPGARLAEQMSAVSHVPVTELSFTGVSSTTERACAVQSRVFTWDIPLTYGGYSGVHCFYATDSCGHDHECSGHLDTVEVCVEFRVAKCKYAVNLEQSIVEIAAHFGTDWIQIWNMNDAKSPDYILFQNQVLNIGHMYTITTGDSLSNLARRFGTTEKSLAFLNYELGELRSVNLTIGQEICMIANSCFGEVQSVWDKHPPSDVALERWYEGVQTAYDALRKAKAEAKVGRRLLTVSGEEEVRGEAINDSLRRAEIQGMLAEMLRDLGGMHGHPEQ
mmetsp:Transcript_3266/g.8206  ORF Transcript_3266/g.8206 Transcript_3266/m.8206 type:complete len:862 (-) Transcript_3266:194-2779(-)